MASVVQGDTQAHLRSRGRVGVQVKHQNLPVCKVLQAHEPDGACRPQSPGKGHGWGWGSEGVGCRAGQGEGRTQGSCYKNWGGGAEREEKGKRSALRGEGLRRWIFGGEAGPWREGAFGGNWGRGVPISGA